MTKHEFNGPETFEAYHAAEYFLVEQGYSIGSMCAPMPTAAFKVRNHLIAKWKNLSPKERRTVDAKIEGDFRNGPVTVTIYR